MAFVKTAAFKACMTVLFSSSLKHKHHLYWLDAVFSAIPYGISLWTVGIFQSPFYGIYFIIICLRAVNLRRFDGISGTSSYTWGFACNFSSPWYFSVISFQVQGIRQPQLDCVNYFPFFKIKDHVSCVRKFAHKYTREKLSRLLLFRVSTVADLWTDQLPRQRFQGNFKELAVLIGFNRWLPNLLWSDFNRADEHWLDKHTNIVLIYGVSCSHQVDEQRLANCNNHLFISVRGSLDAASGMFV